LPGSNGVLPSGAVAGPVYQCDFSSHYCSILRDCALPVRLRYGRRRRQGSLLEGDFWRKGAASSRVQVRTDWPEYPYSRDGIIIYPTGTFWTVLCGPDLYPALDSGRVLAWGAWASYDLERAFRDWASSILRLRSDARLRGDKALEAFAKALGRRARGQIRTTGTSLGGHGPARRGGALVSADLPRWRRQGGPGPLPGRTPAEAGRPRRDAREHARACGLRLCGGQKEVVGRATGCRTG
jgi:hypothetical protein